MVGIEFFSLLLCVLLIPVDCLTDAQESAFPRRSCLCDIGVRDHVMIMPIHEKSRPLKNCAVAVEYCKQICGPAVARQILGFREFTGLEDVTLATKPFWNMQRSLGDLLCQNLGMETSQPLELAVYSQAKSCGRRVPALNGSFTEERLCCRQDEHSALVRAYTCLVSAASTATSIIPSTPLTTASSDSEQTPSPAGSRLPTIPKDTIPEPIEMHGEMRARMRAQFRSFLDMLQRGATT